MDSMAKDSSQVTLSDNNQLVKINPVLLSDPGVYQCIASNTISEIVVDIILYVTTKECHHSNEEKMGRVDNYMITAFLLSTI